MSTIHEFQNYERFIAQGEEALVEHNQIAALENFQQAYQLQQTPPVNQKLSNYCWKWVKLMKH